MHNYTCATSCIPQIWPEKFCTPWKIAQQCLHLVASWMNYWINFHIPLSCTSYGFHTPRSQLLQFSWPRQFHSALLPSIKNDRSLIFAGSSETFLKDIYYHVGMPVLIICWSLDSICSPKNDTWSSRLFIHFSD